VFDSFEFPSSLVRSTVFSCASLPRSVHEDDSAKVESNTTCDGKIIRCREAA
jgi:hypothetical protein